MTQKTGDTGDRSPRHTKIGSADLDLEATGLETEPNLQAGPGLKLEPDLTSAELDLESDLLDNGLVPENLRTEPG